MFLLGVIIARGGSDHPVFIHMNYQLSVMVAGFLESANATKKIVAFVPLCGYTWDPRTTDFFRSIEG